MSAGASGAAVESLQRMLRAQGCYDGAIDGVFGTSTGDAVLEFQGRYPELEQTGACDSTTWVRLADADRPFHDPEDRARERLLYLQWPMLRGDDVEELQLRLSWLGFHQTRIDGVFGPQTEASVGQFQRNTGLIEDRVCGPETREVLVDLTARHDEAPFAAVLEREWLLLNPDPSLQCGIGAAPADGAATLGPALGRALTALGRPVRVITGSATDQADLCNRLDLGVFVHVAEVDQSVVTVAYFGRDGRHGSVAGRRLAERLAEQLGPQVAPILVATEARQTVRLTHTRCPAVDVEFPRQALEGLDAAELARVINEALAVWRTDLSAEV